MKTLLLRLSFALILLGTAALAAAQPTMWHRAYGGLQLDMFYAVCESADSNIICAGETQSSGAGLRDGWLVKLAPNGNILWSRTYGGTREDECFAVQRVSDGGYILAGRTSSLESGWDGYAVRVDSGGQMLWSHHFGGPQRDEFGAVCEAPDGGFLFAGLRGGNQFWAMKLSAAGDSLWSRTYGGSGTDQCYAAQAIGDGFYLAGSTESYGNGRSQSPDFWLLKINSTGDSLCSQTFGGIESDVCTAMTLLPSGGGVLCGYTQSYGAGQSDIWAVRFGANCEYLASQTFGSTRYDFGQAIWTTHDHELLIAGNIDLGTGSTDFWVVKTGADFTPRWSRNYGGTATEDCRAVMETSTGRILLVGGTFSEGAGSEDGYVISTDPPIAILHADPPSMDFGSILVGNSASANLVLTNIGTDSLILTQMQIPAGFHASLTFPFVLLPNSDVWVPVTFTPDSARGYRDTLWVFSSAPASPLGVELTGTGLANSAEAPEGILPVKFALNPPYPNPFNASTTLSFDLPRAGHVTLSIFDAAGRLVEILAEGSYAPGRYRFHYDAAALSSGVYFARMQGAGFSATRKLVLMK